MSVYRPSYRDAKTGKLKRSRVWWYNFSFAGRRIQESSKSTRKTLAVEAEKKRRLELEQVYNSIQDKRKNRIRPLKEVADAYLVEYRVRHRSATFAEHAIRHVKRLVGAVLTADVSAQTVKDYQTARLKEKAAPKTINEEVVFLLRLLAEQGEYIRAKMRREKTLKLAVGHQTARAFTLEEKAAMVAEARNRRSPHIVPALALALHAGLRDAEIRGLQWERVNLEKGILTVGDSKTEAGAGRTIPLNADLLAALIAHAKWYLKTFGETRPEWYLFPFGKPQPTDPTRSATTFKTVWAKVKAEAGVKGRWHDARHTFITDLAEQGEVSDETIRQLAGHVSKKMLEHYSHIRMKAKRAAVATLETEPKQGPFPGISIGPAKEIAKVRRLN